MRPGSWDGAVSTENARVWINGVLLPKEMIGKVTTTSGMRDGHPSAQGGSWCVEAQIEWQDPAMVTSTSPHLFGGDATSDNLTKAATEWLPKPGDKVLIHTGDGALGQWWKQHEGVIDDTSGSIADGTAKSTTVDNIEDLSGRVQFGALLHRMTPWSDAHDYRNIGLSSLFMVDRMWRNPQTQNVGWYATPPTTWQTVASATMIGSAWPEVGTLRICGRSQSQTNTQFGGWRNTSYGTAPWRVFAEYLLTSAIPEVILTVSAEQPSNGVARWRVVDANDYGCFIRVRGDSGVIQYGITTSGTVTYEIPLGDATRVALSFRRNTTTSQTLVIRTDDGREETRTTSAAAFPNGFTMDRMYVGTDDYGQAPWWMVEGTKPDSQRWFTLNSKPTARLRRSADVRWLASRDLPFTMPSEWLAEQVDAECSQMWLDEDNHMQWTSRGVLEAQYPVRTITSVRDVDDIQWEQKRRYMARSVWVNYLDPQVRSLLGGFRQNCWGTNSIDLAPGESETVTVSIPSEEDWISVDLNSSLMTSAMAPWHLRMGSKHGGTQYTESASGESGQIWARFIDYSLTRMGLRNFSVYFGQWASSTQRVKSAIPNLNDKDTRPPANIDAWHSGNDAIRIRSRAITTWSEGERSLNAGSIGPARYTHDVDWRVQNFHIVDGVGELMSWLREQVTDTTKPVITGITIAHDPRLQIGDKIRIRDTEITGIDFDVLIQQRDVDTAEMTEKITGRVTLVRQQVQYTSLAAEESRYEPSGPDPTTPTLVWDREPLEAT